MLDAKLLSTFREVAIRRSFSTAADALGFTQPAVSQHISRLEKSVGARLLERDARGVHLTAPGEVLLRHADIVLEQLRRAEDEVRTAAGIGRPILRIGTFPTAAAGLLPLAARELRAHLPDVEIDLQVLEPDEAVEQLVVGTLDVATVIESSLMRVREHPGVDYISVFEDPMLVALSADHRLAGRRAIALEELRDEPWLLTEIGGTCEDSNVVLRACREAGFTPSIRFESEDYQALQGMAAAGLGVVLIPSLAAVSTRPDVVVRPILGRPPVRHILLAVRTEHDPIVDRFVEAVRRSAAALPGAGMRLADAA